MLFDFDMIDNVWFLPYEYLWTYMFIANCNVFVCLFLNTFILVMKKSLTTSCQILSIIKRTARHWWTEDLLNQNATRNCFYKLIPFLFFFVTFYILKELLTMLNIDDIDLSMGKIRFTTVKNDKRSINNLVLIDISTIV